MARNFFQFQIIFLTIKNIYWHLFLDLIIIIIMKNKVISFKRLSLKYFGDFKNEFLIVFFSMYKIKLFSRKFVQFEILFLTIKNIYWHLCLDLKIMIIIKSKVIYYKSLSLKYFGNFKKEVFFMHKTKCS